MEKLHPPTPPPQSNSTLQTSLSSGTLPESQPKQSRFHTRNPKPDGEETVAETDLGFGTCFAVSKLRNPTGNPKFAKP